MSFSCSPSCPLQSKTVVSIHPAGSLDWKDSIVEVEIKTWTPLSQPGLRWRCATMRKVRNLGNFLFSPPPLPSLSPLTAGPYWSILTGRISHSPQNEGYLWVRVVLTPSTVRLGVPDARATEDQGSDDVFVTGSLLVRFPD